jgi:3-deoxy-D-manno-octulosonate 8-phosphate phosphatase (KDO 8-P phosphatase)
MKDVPREILDRAARVRLVLLDVDGVLTDGKLLQFSDGTEGRAFHVRDGYGIKMGQRLGLAFGILSGRASKVAEARGRELGIEEVHVGVLEKDERYEEIVRRLGLTDEEVCYMGDDLVDVPVLRRVGLGVAPAGASEEAAMAAHWITERAGGDGAVREAITLILKAQGKWEGISGAYFKTR